MPLGVFALTPDGQASGPDPSLFLQLAISKEGIISGTLHNSATNSTQTIEGMADKATQRAAWTVAGKTRPIMETGIVNLTEDTAPALVHFADGQTQQWLMVRLEEPEEQVVGDLRPQTIRVSVIELRGTDVRFWMRRLRLQELQERATREWTEKRISPSGTVSTPACSPGGQLSLPTEQTGAIRAIENAG